MGKPIFSKSPYYVMFVGLDNAGKTTLIKHTIGDKSLAMCSPTMGCDSREYFHLVESDCMKCRRMQRFFLMDLGGHERIRDTWEPYYDTSVGICFVFDAADNNRFDEVEEILGKVIQEEQRRKMPLLIVANKQDLNCKIRNQCDFRTQFPAILEQPNIRFAVGTAVKEEERGEQLMDDLSWLLNACITDSVNIGRMNAAVKNLENEHEALSRSEKFAKMDSIKKRNDDLDKEANIEGRETTELGIML